MRFNWFYLIPILVILVFIFTFAFATNRPVQNNKVNATAVIAEINRLLPLMESQTITAADFDNLEHIVLRDRYATGEVEEMKVLASDKEYPHIGHSLGFLYSYITTGKELICPGHELAHYYVFTKHNQSEFAAASLSGAKEDYSAWKNQIYFDNTSSSNEITSFETAFDAAIIRVTAGNSTASDAEIADLSEATCAS